MTDAEIMRDLQWTVKRVRKAIRQHVHPILHGKPPEVQSAVIADIAATYLAGVAPQHRGEFKEMLFQLIEDLIPENERELFGEAGHPGRPCPS